MLVSTAVIPVMVLFESRRHLDVGRIWPLVIGGIAGIPVGAYLLLVLASDVIRVFAGLVVAASTLAFLAGFKREVKNERAAWVPIGVASGILGGSVSMSGPPAILFLSNQGVGKDAFRANLTFYFTIMTAATALVYFAGGLLTAEVAGLALVLVPATLAGTFAGIRLSHRIRETVCDRLVLVFLLMLGVMAVVTGLGFF